MTTLIIKGVCLHMIRVRIHDRSTSVYADVLNDWVLRG